MSRKGKFVYEIKIQAVKECIHGKSSINATSKQTGASKRQIKEWISQYRSMGEAGLRVEHTNKRYTATAKQAAVKDYLTGSYSLLAVCQKYQIRSTTQLRQWIKKYNGHEVLKSSGTGGHIMTKGRKTTFDERVEIVKACIEQQHNYNVIAEAYQVSYQQVRSWTVKYEQFGVEALSDHRGRRKPDSEMTVIEKLIAENKLLEAKNRRLALEVEFLKKLKELEGGGE